MGNDSFVRQLWRWLIGSGGAVIAVCFFLPFLAVSANTEAFNNQGLSLDSLGGLGMLFEVARLDVALSTVAGGLLGLGGQPVLYLVLMGGILGGIAAFTPDPQKQIGGIVAIVCAGVVIVALGIVYYNSTNAMGTLQQLGEQFGIDTTALPNLEQLQELIKIQWSIGLYGLILGIALLIAGALLALFMQTTEVSYDYPPGANPQMAIPPTAMGVPPTFIPPTDIPYQGGMPSNVYPPSIPSTQPPTAPPTIGGRRRDNPQSAQPPLQTVADATPRNTRGWLMVTGGAPGREYLLEQRTIIGRDGRRARVVVDDPRVSSEHAAVVYENHRFVLHDLASTNGTYWNGNRVSSPRPLMDGDRVRVGQIEFIFKEVR